MRKDDAALPVEELIRRYQQELMDFRKRQTATPTMAQAAMPIEAQEDPLEQFPEPDIMRDLQNLRTQAPPTPDQVIPEEQLPEELEPGEMAESPATDIENIDETVPPAQPQQGVPAFPSAPSPSVLPVTPPQEMSLGYLQVAVTTARGALPVPGAHVLVTRVADGEEMLEKSAITNISGRTPLFTLPAVSSVYSLTPGNDAPYTYYTIYVRQDGYFPVQLRNVPLYGGVTAVQPVELIPLPEGSDPLQTDTIIEGAPANLL